MSKNRGHKRREELREQAKVLQEARATRSPEQQLHLLDKRLGEGLGAAKERHRLQLMIDESKSSKKTTKKIDKPKAKKKSKK